MESNLSLSETPKTRQGTSVYTVRGWGGHNPVSRSNHTTSWFVRVLHLRTGARTTYRRRACRLPRRVRSRGSRQNQIQPSRGRPGPSPTGQLRVISSESLPGLIRLVHPPPPVLPSTPNTFGPVRCRKYHSLTGLEETRVVEVDLSLQCPYLGRTPRKRRFPSFLFFPTPSHFTEFTYPHGNYIHLLLSLCPLVFCPTTVVHRDPEENSVPTLPVPLRHRSFTLECP